MDILVVSDGKVLFEGKATKANGVIFKVRDGKAAAQFEFDGKHLGVSGDGGKPYGGWEVELQVPRVKEPKPKPSGDGR